MDLLCKDFRKLWSLGFEPVNRWRSQSHALDIDSSWNNRWNISGQNVHGNQDCRSSTQGVTGNDKSKHSSLLIQISQDVQELLIPVIWPLCQGFHDCITTLLQDPDPGQTHTLVSKPVQKWQLICYNVSDDIFNALRKKTLDKLTSFGHNGQDTRLWPWSLGQPGQVTWPGCPKTGQTLDNDVHVQDRPSTRRTGSSQHQENRMSSRLQRPSFSIIHGRLSKVVAA